MTQLCVRSSSASSADNQLKVLVVKETCCRAETITSSFSNVSFFSAFFFMIIFFLSFWTDLTFEEVT